MGTLDDGRARRRPWRWILVAAVVLTVVTSPAYADAAPTVRWVAYAGQSISMQRVPAEPVVLTALSSTSFTSATFAVEDRAGTVPSSAVIATGGQSRASAEVDLTGASGRTTITVVFTNGRITSTVRKVLVAVPSTSSASPVGAQLGSPAVSTPTSPAEPTVLPPVASPPTPETPASTDPGSSPSPSPSPAPAPAPVVDPAVRAVAARTGVPDGVALVPQTGNITVRQAGTVIDGVALTGCITVRADDVVIRNSRIRCTSSTTAMVVATNGNYRNLVIEDSELDGGGGVDIGVGWQNFTLRRVEITGVNDGVRAGSNSVIQDSWVHDMTRRGELHPDAVQSTGGTGIVITGNVLDPTNATTGDLGNAAVMMGSETNPVLADVVISGNQLGGGNYTVNIRGDSAASNISISGNVFTGGARYGPLRVPSSTGISATNTMSVGGAAPQVVLSN